MFGRKPLSVAAAAKRLGVTGRTIQRYCESGIFPNAFILDTDKKRSVWVIPHDDIEAYLEKERQQKKFKK